MNFTDIAEHTSKLFDVPAKDIMSCARFDYIVEARFAAILACKMHGMNVAEITRLTGRKCRTSTRNAVRRANTLYTTSTSYQKKVDLIREWIDSRVETCQTEGIPRH